MQETDEQPVSIVDDIEDWKREQEEENDKLD